MAYPPSAMTVEQKILTGHLDVVKRTPSRKVDRTPAAKTGQATLGRKNRAVVRKVDDGAQMTPDKGYNTEGTIAKAGPTCKAS